MRWNLLALLRCGSLAAQTTTRARHVLAFCTLARRYQPLRVDDPLQMDAAAFAATVAVACTALWRRATQRKAAPVNAPAFAQLLRAAVADGVEHLQLVLDFDRTVRPASGQLVRGSCGGHTVAHSLRVDEPRTALRSHVPQMTTTDSDSSHGMLEVMRSPAFQAKAKAMLDFYLPIETDTR